MREGATRMYTDTSLAARLAFVELVLSLAYFAAAVAYLKTTRAA